MPTDPSFRMTVDDVFSIAGRGTVVTGKVESGTLRLGDEVVIRSGGSAGIKATVAGIEMFRKTLFETKAGDAVGILLRDIKKDQVTRGAELLSPDMAI